MKEMSEMKHLSDPFSSPITQENEKTKQTNLITILIISVNCVPFCECILLFLTWRDGPVFWMKNNNNTIHNFLLTLIHTWWSWNQMNLPCSHKKKKGKKGRDTNFMSNLDRVFPMIACWHVSLSMKGSAFLLFSVLFFQTSGRVSSLSILLQGSCWHACHEFPMCFPQSQSSSLFARMKMTITQFKQ